MLEIENKQVEDQYSQPALHLNESIPEILSMWKSDRILNDEALNGLSNLFKNIRKSNCFTLKQCQQVFGKTLGKSVYLDASEAVINHNAVFNGTIREKFLQCIYDGLLYIISQRTTTNPISFKDIRSLFYNHISDPLFNDMLNKHVTVKIITGQAYPCPI